MSELKIEERTERMRQAMDATIKYTHFFSVSNAKDEYIATLHCQKRHDVMWFTSLWVHGDHRQGGLGRRLMQAAVDQLGGYDCYLQVMGYTDQPLSDEQLIRFYGRFGFQSTEVPGILCRNADTEVEA